MIIKVNDEPTDRVPAEGYSILLMRNGTVVGTYAVTGMEND